MFKQFEQAAQEHTKQGGAANSSSNPFAGLGGEMDDAKMMDMFKGLLGGAESKGDGSEELFNQF